MSQTAQVEVRVLGGFPLTVEISRRGTWASGFEYEITDIMTPAGKSAEFITKRLSPKEYDDMLDRAIDRAF